MPLFQFEGILCICQGFLLLLDSQFIILCVDLQYFYAFRQHASLCEFRMHINNFTGHLCLQGNLTGRYDRAHGRYLHGIVLRLQGLCTDQGLHLYRWSFVSLWLGCYQKSRPSNTCCNKQKTDYYAQNIAAHHFRFTRFACPVLIIFMHSHCKAFLLFNYSGQEV